VRRSTKILLAGLGLSVLVLAAGYLNTLRLEKRENALRAECAKPEAAHGFDLSTAVPADLNMDRPWAEITADPIFKALGPDDQERARRNYVDRSTVRSVHDGGHFVPTCDPRELVSSGLDLIGVQAKLVEADRAVTDSKAWPLTVALAVFVLGALPWAWYALLRRIGELRAAIGGKPPEL
jgi:hypothetical protein